MRLRGLPEAPKQLVIVGRQVLAVARCNLALSIRSRVQTAYTPKVQ